MKCWNLLVDLLARTSISTVLVQIDFFLYTVFFFLQPVNFLSRSLNLSSSNRKNDSGLLNRAFVQVQSEKMSYRKMPSHFRPPAPVSPAATPFHQQISW